MKILAMAASTSSKSINASLIRHAAQLLEGGMVPDCTVEILDLNEFEMPLYSTDRQEAGGVPELAQTFFDKIGSSDAVIFSFAEHNGTYSAAYKNVLDWASRIDMQIFQGKQVVLFAASPGGRGGAGVLELATTTAPYFGAELQASLSIGKFFDVFDSESGELSDPEVAAEFQEALASITPA